MKKIALLVPLIVVLLLVVTFVINRNINKIQEPKVNNSSQEELIKTFKGKFVSFKYPENFNVFVDNYDNIFINPKFKNTYPFEYVLKIHEFNSDNYKDSDKKLPIEIWFNYYALDTERGAPNPDENMSYKFKLAGIYDAFYTIYVSEKVYFRSEFYEHYSPVFIYINNNQGRVFEVNTQKIDSDSSVSKQYSLEEIAQAKQYEKIVDEIIQSIRFVE